MRALGITCGIGSMLVGARDAGFEVIGNIEWRKYYHHKDAEGRNTFTDNFPNAFMEKRIEDLAADQAERIRGVDLAIGHPECGNFSQLSAMNPDKTGDAADIPLFVDLVAKVRPRFFVMDDLPKSFLAFPMSEYAERLSDYDLFPEWVSNYHYGNVQKNRKRMFMIGALKNEAWTFVPGETEHELTMKDVLGDILGREGELPNHDVHALDEICQRAKHLESLGRDAEATYAQLRDYFLEKPEGFVMRYWSSYGQLKVKPSHSRAYWDGHMHVMDGTAVQVHPVRGTPLTIRERARLQGFPDDFVFRGAVLNERGEYNHEKNNRLVKQTGKAMPVQFNRYVARQIAAHINGEQFKASGARLIQPSSYVNLAKEWFCENVGYANQLRACGACWLYASCRIRARKYGIGEPPGDQPDLPLPPKVPITRFKDPREQPRKSKRFAELDRAPTTITFGGEDEGGEG